MTSLNTLKAEAVKRFEEKFEELHHPYQRGGCAMCGFRGWDTEIVTELVKSFLLSEIDRAVEAATEEIKTMEKPTKGKLNPNLTAQETAWINDGYNLALNDLLQKLSSLKEK